jgi:hypothetical protein
VPVDWHGLGRIQAYAELLEQAIDVAAPRLRRRILRHLEAHGLVGSRMSDIGLVLEGRRG